MWTLVSQGKYLVKKNRMPWHITEWFLFLLLAGNMKTQWTFSGVYYGNLVVSGVNLMVCIVETLITVPLELQISNLSTLSLYHFVVVQIFLPQPCFPAVSLPYVNFCSVSHDSLHSFVCLSVLGTTPFPRVLAPLLQI